jgi:hypothetical protein
MEKLAIEGSYEMKSDSDITRRLEWIRHKADWLDPMAECTWTEVDNA